jgi:hypothetical protein
MRNPAKKILSGTLWIGRGTATVMGVAVFLALTVGLASTAVAGTGVGARFDLGKTNAVNAISSLVGSVAGPSLKIDNNSTGTGATALRLEVEPGKPPMSVNSTTEVQGLNVDSLDGKNSSDFLQVSSDREDFLPRRTYQKSGALVTLGVNETGFAKADCDAGDVALSGGYTVGFGASTTVFSVGTGVGGSSVGFTGPRGVIANVTCADFPPLRP